MAAIIVYAKRCREKITFIHFAKSGAPCAKRDNSTQARLINDIFHIIFCLDVN